MLLQMYEIQVPVNETSFNHSPKDNPMLRFHLLYVAFASKGAT